MLHLLLPHPNKHTYKHTTAGTYTDADETVTQKGEWLDDMKNGLFVETYSKGGQMEFFYENDQFIGGSAMKRPRHMALFFNSLKKRTFKVKDGVLFYFNADKVEKGHIDLANYDVYEAGNKNVVSDDPCSLVLR